MVNKNNIEISLFEKVPRIKGRSKAESRKLHLEYALSKTEILGSVLEFGVFEGTTINIISNFFKTDNVFGFDSFEGLPEDWHTTEKTVWKAGHFKVDNLPNVNSNVKLVKGWFDITLPDWLTTNNIDSVKFLHIDCDLYSSTKTVLSFLNNKIKPGTIIVFDELYHWKNSSKYKLWKEGEYKALCEWISEFDREFKILSTSSYMQCAIQITK